jgi:hypothetical protein
MNYIFIHAAILDFCKERLIQYLDIINESNINVARIFICFVGPADKIPIDTNLLAKYPQNIEICHLSSDLQEYELPTLCKLYEFCINEPNNTNNVLYLHTKNVGKQINVCIEDQINYMLHFNITKWENCIHSLEEYNTCGVDLRKEPVLHYSGNFWWAKTSYISTLPHPHEFNNLIKYPNPLNSIRHNQEFWICYKNRNMHYSLWDCGINVYERHLHRYKPLHYINN